MSALWVLQMVALTGLAAASSPPAWPMHGHDAANTRLSALDGPSSQSAHVTTIPLGDLDNPLSSVVVSGNGDIIAGSLNGLIFAVDSNGGTRRFHRQDFSAGTPAVTDDGTVVVGFQNGQVLGISADFSSTPLWQFDAEAGISTPVVLAAGFVFFVTDDSTTYCLVATNGTLIWTAPMANAKSSSSMRLLQTVPGVSPPAYSSGHVVVGRSYAARIDIYSGSSLKCSIDMPGVVYATPSILDLKGSVFVGVTNEANSYLVAASFSSGCVVEWSVALVGRATTSPAIGPDQLVYINTDSGDLYGITTAGIVSWHKPGPACGALSIGANGTLYAVCGFDVIAINGSTGDVLFTIVDASPSTTYSTPVIPESRALAFAAGPNVVILGPGLKPSPSPPSSPTASSSVLPSPTHSDSIPSTTAPSSAFDTCVGLS